MATKIHVGFRDGKLTSGKCEADKGKCPYGNHFPSQSEADKYQEHVSEILHSPKYRDLAAGFEAMGEGGNAMTTEQALANGFPPEIAKLIGGEPTDPKYARENVGVEAVEEPVAETMKMEEVNVSPTVDSEKLEAEQPPVAEVEAEDSAVDAKADSPKPRVVAQGEAISHDVPPEPGSIDLNTPEGVERFHQILDSYRVSDSDEFKKLSPYLRDAIYGSDDPKAQRYKIERELENYARAVNSVRGGSMQQIKAGSPRRLQDVAVEMVTADNVASKYYEKKGLEPPTAGAFRPIANYGEIGNEINDLIAQDALIRGISGKKNRSDSIAANKAINPAVVFEDGVAGEADWNRELGKTLIPYSASTEMGYDPDIEMNKFRRYRFVNEYSDMLAKDRNLKKRANISMDGLTVAEIEEKISSPRYEFNSKKPVYSGAEWYSSQEGMAEAYYDEAARRTAAKLKPGSYVMLNNYDAEVYQIGEDGALLTPEGKVWGHVDFETGAMHDAYGRNIYDMHDGARLYGDADELMRYAALDDRTDGLDTSADPGYRSKYEDDPKLSKKFERAVKYLKTIEDLENEAAVRQQEFATASRSYSPSELYDIATVKFGMPHFDKELAQDKSKEALIKKEVMVQDYLREQFMEHGARNNFRNGTIVKSNRRGLSALAPKKSLEEVLGNNIPVATKASIINAAKRKRNRETTQGDQFAGAFERKANEVNPTSKRRRSWGEEPLPPAYARTGDLLYNPVEKTDDKHETYVVVDRERGLMAPVATLTAQHRTKPRYSKQAGLDPNYGLVPEKHLALTSEYAIQDVLNRYEMGDPSLKVERMSLEEDNDRALMLW